MVHHHESEVARLRFIFKTVLLIAIIIIGAANLVLVTRLTAPAPAEVDLSSIEGKLSSISSNLDTLSTKLDTLEGKVSRMETGAAPTPVTSTSLSAEGTYALSYEPVALLYHGNYVYAALNNTVLNRYSFNNFIGGKVGTFSSSYELDYVGGDFIVRLGYVYVNRDQQLYQYTWDNYLADASHVGDPYSLSYNIDAMLYKDEYVFVVREGDTMIYKYDWNNFLTNGNHISSYDLGFAPESMFYYDGYVYVADAKTLYKYRWGDFNSVF